MRIRARLNNLRLFRFWSQLWCPVAQLTAPTSQHHEQNFHFSWNFWSPMIGLPLCAVVECVCCVDMNEEWSVNATISLEKIKINKMEMVSLRHHLTDAYYCCCCRIVHARWRWFVLRVFGTSGWDALNALNSTIDVRIVSIEMVDNGLT